MANKINWSKEQLMAIQTRGKNIIVSAGAGSGKTEVLSERVIYNLKNNYMHINEMLILTFTKNAAAEMKERIKKKILQENDIKEEAKLIESADITNFDAYTLALVKKYHYLLNLDNNISIIDSSIINKIKNDYLNEIFERNASKIDFQNFITSFCSKNTNELKNMIKTIYNKIDLITNKEEYLKSYIDTYYDDKNIEKLFLEYESSIKDKIKVIKLILENLEYEVPSNFYQNYYQALTPLINAETYNEIKSSLDIGTFRLTGATSLGKEYKKQITNIINDLKDELKFPKETLINNLKNTKDNSKIIIDIIDELSSKIDNYKKYHNVYEFNDISKFAIKIIKENNELREELKNHYKEIMIDEYQDTSDIEEEFINLIENNNVYMVGDIKQSIYRFRNANPNIFKEKYDLYKNTDKGIKIDLNNNFRSRKEVLSCINEIFNHIMDIKIGNADYEQEHKLIPGNIKFDTEGKTSQNNLLEIYNYEKNNKNTTEEIESFIIANDIKNKINNKYQVYDNGLRPCKYSDFCILMDRGTTFKTYKKVFDYLNIPLHIYQDEDILFETETYLINNIIGLLINIKNKIFDETTSLYYASIARSYLIEEKDEDIYNVINNKKIKETKIYQMLLPLSKEIDNLSNEEILNKIIDIFDINNKLISVGNIKEKNIILNNLLTKFAELNTVGIDIYGINEYIKSLINNKDNIKITGTKTNIDSVTLTNIHKSKGLEYKICYFSGFDKKFSNQDEKPKIRFDNTYGLILPYYNNCFIETFVSTLSKENNKIEDISEKLRLFYVALTRCKEKMIMLSSLTEKEDYLFDGEIVDYITRSNYNNFESIISSVYPYIKNYITNVDTPTINNDYKLKKEVSIKSTEENIITVNERYFNIEKLNEEHYSKNSIKFITPEEKDNMEFGTHIHYILEITDFKNPNYEYLSKTEQEIIENLLSNPIFKNIENGNIFKEYEFVYEKDNIQKNGIIDLMIEYKGHIDIIDYKLKNTEDNAYKLQLNGYKEYIKNLTSKEVNTYLYSILDRKIIEIK